MADQPCDEEALFHAARRLPSPGERAEYLRGACGDDPAVRGRVQELLRAYDEERSLGGVRLGPTIDAVEAMPLPGTLIGRYRLLEQIGEGGFGIVFMAEQQHPVRRRVALKVIKPGMDTRQVIARFEAERQALALMDHPNIAKVFDAGVTDSGRPYFVMELVKGLPITKYCDEHKRTPRQRLELFVQVCQAVQHAHQKGVIHRDLKPTNVLVAQYDGKPVPKVIDFGVAKAAGQQLTERTLFTGFGDVVGTPQYMSPEQAELNQLDIDTRSDVYSLGVLLYELLTGTTPLESKRLKEAALLEVLRVIREEEPPRPSTRLTTVAELPSIAAQRGLEPKSLSGIVKGELDWIVMKALEKDRGRRYETAYGLARDVERYLRDEPVSACPPSAAYRMRKLARRHRLAVVAALTFVAILIALVAGLTVTNRVITKSRNETAAALRLKEQALLEAQAERRRAEDNFFKARVVVKDLLLWPAAGRGEARLPDAVQKKLLEAATTYYSSLGDEHSADPSLRYDAAVGQTTLGYLRQKTGDLKRSEELLRRSGSTLQALHEKHPDRPEYGQHLGWSRYMLSETLNAGHRSAEALVAAEQAREVYERLIAAHPEATSYRGDVWWVYGTLADMHAAAGRMEVAAEMLGRRVNVNPAAHSSWYEAAGFYLFMGDVERYHGACREMLDRFEKTAQEQPLIAERTVKTCALAPDSVPDFARVDRLAERCLAGTETDVNRGYFVIAKGLADYRAGRYEAAVERLRVTGAGSSDAIPLACLAMAHHRLGRHDDARAALESARALLAKESPDARRTSVELMQGEILIREAGQVLSGNSTATTSQRVQPKTKN
jgi:serine/threonine protein kinase/tetratricopeptide (TPR) repeat protein